MGISQYRCSYVDEDNIHHGTGVVDCGLIHESLFARFFSHLVWEFKAVTDSQG